jgi:hypothetical protein
MNRLLLLGVALLIAVSGCQKQEPPSVGNSQAAAAQAPAQAAAGKKELPAAGSAAAPASSEIGETAPEAAPPAQAAPDAERRKAEPAKPEAADTAAKQQGTNADASRSSPGPRAAAADSSSAAAQQTRQESEQPAAPATKDVTIRIVGDKQHGVILQETAEPFHEGATVIDVLKQATREHKIQMEYKGQGAYAYVQGIDNLYEFDGGPKSGWVYKVNGRAPGEGAGAYKLKAGDKIEWLYTLDLGEDVGAKMK